MHAMPKMEMSEIMNVYNIKNRRYLGSKAKLIPFIKKVISENCTDINVFLDLFGGTGNVAWSFNDRYTTIMVNDILESNHLSYLSFFDSSPIDDQKLVEIIESYNKLVIKEDNYFSLNFANTYFSIENCKKIGFIRDDIEKKYILNQINIRERAVLVTSLIYAMDGIANTVGHYDAYRLHGDLNKELVLKFLELPDRNTNLNNIVFKEDANTLVKRISADIVYIDPPYNSRQYSDAYHLLENVAEWSKPTVYGTAKKMDRSAIKSKYCTKSAPKQFEDLIKNINARYILVSYNNMGNKGAGRSQAKISDNEIIEILSSKGKVDIFETEFSQFTTGATEIDDHKERLFLCSVGKETEDYELIEKINGFVKSPLNYTGGKYRLLPQLLEKFPRNIETFVDMFGGGFNVGANVTANTIVYNDFQKEVVRLIKLFAKYSASHIIHQIENIITKYNLSNTYENGYEFYNCNSDSGVGKYNKDNYLALRDEYNSIKRSNEKKDFLLLTLVIFAFNNQIRFNSKNEFNMPVGKRDFNSSIRKNVREFATILKNKTLEFSNIDFRKIEIDSFSNPFFYCDPPYILGTASYNEGNGWSENDELKLLELLNRLNEKGIPFALSNVIEHKGMTHHTLKNWAEKNYYSIIYIKSSYGNSNYQIKDRSSITREVLITNY